MTSYIQKGLCTTKHIATLLIKFFMPKTSLIFIENRFFTDYNFDEMKDRLTFRYNVLLFEQSKEQEPEP